MTLVLFALASVPFLFVLYQYASAALYAFRQWNTRDTRDPLDVDPWEEEEPVNRVRSAWRSLLYRLRLPLERGKRSLRSCRSRRARVAGEVPVSLRARWSGAERDNAARVSQDKWLLSFYEPDAVATWRQAEERLARRTEQERSAARLLDYRRSLKAETSMDAVRSMLALEPLLGQTPEFRDWGLANFDALFPPASSKL